MSYFSDQTGTETFDDPDVVEEKRVELIEEGDPTSARAHLATTAEIAITAEERLAHEDELHEALAQQGME